MPFRKPEPLSYKIVICDDGAVFHALWRFGSLSNREGVPPEYLVLETRANTGVIRLEFCSSLLKESIGMPASLYCNSTNVFLIVRGSRDSRDLLHGGAPFIGLGDIAIGKRILILLDWAYEEKEKFIGSGALEEYDAYFFCNSFQRGNIHELIHLITKLLVESGKSFYRSIPDEMSVVNLSHDKTSLINSTMCFERNSIG